MTNHNNSCSLKWMLDASLTMSYLVAGASAVLDLRLVPVVGLEDLSADPCRNHGTGFQHAMLQSLLKPKIYYNIEYIDVYSI